MESINKNKWTVAEIQISYKSNIKPEDRPKITSSRESFSLLRSEWDSSRIEIVEQFKILLLNRANKAIGIYEVSTGGISGTVADPKIIFAVALKAGASGVILAHNHPSGNLQPSKADIDLTKKLSSGGKYLEISILDHLIVTTDKYLSFADEGLL